MVSKQQYEEQKVSTSTEALRSLLHGILIDEKLSEKERKKRIKQVLYLYFFYILFLEFLIHYQYSLGKVAKLSLTKEKKFYAYFLQPIPYVICTSDFFFFFNAIYL